jgi:8-oxo-dGTP pyrophosphatase MutT (NUDIX family)
VTRIALAVLTLPDGRLVFQRRDGGAPVSPHLLGLFGGHLEPGEAPEAAMARELEEETSLRAAECALRRSTVLELPAASGGHPADRIEVTVFTGSAPHAEFAVFEGAGAEVYAREVALGRDDLAPTARAVLHSIPAR